MTGFRDQGAARAAEVFRALCAGKSAAEIDRIRAAENRKLDAAARTLDATDEQLGEFLDGFTSALRMAFTPPIEGWE